MKKHIWMISIFVLSALMLGNVVLSASAHSGGTDSRGGHTNRSTGEYHYHHGYSAHDHYDMDGDGDVDCPYSFKDNTSTNSGNTSTNAGSVPSVTQVQNNQKQSSKDGLKSALFNVMAAVITGYISYCLLSWIVTPIFGEDKGCLVYIVVFLVITLASLIYIFS